MYTRFLIDYLRDSIDHLVSHHQTPDVNTIAKMFAKTLVKLSAKQDGASASASSQAFSSSTPPCPPELLGPVNRLKLSA